MYGSALTLLIGGGSDKKNVLQKIVFGRHLWTLTLLELQREKLPKNIDDYSTFSARKQSGLLAY